MTTTLDLLTSDIDLNDAEEIDYDNLPETILDLSKNLETRVSALEAYYNKKEEDAIEIISRLNGMYQMSGIITLERFLCKICTHSELSTLLKLQAAKALVEYEELSDEDDTDEVILLIKERNIRMCYNLSMQTQVNELTSTRIFEMSYIEYLEALARQANDISLPSLYYKEEDEIAKATKEEKKTEVYLVVNLQKLENLSDYVENETFQKLSLIDSKFKINLNNDIDNLKVAIYPSIVDGVPIVYPTFFDLNKREKITIENSNVSSMHLEIKGWTPLFYFNNN